MQRFAMTVACLFSERLFMTGQIAGINPKGLELRGPSIHFVSLG